MTVGAAPTTSSDSRRKSPFYPYLFTHFIRGGGGGVTPAQNQIFPPPPGHLKLIVSNWRYFSKCIFFISCNACVRFNIYRSCKRKKETRMKLGRSIQNLWPFSKFSLIKTPFSWIRDFAPPIEKYPLFCGSCWNYESINNGIWWLYRYCGGMI